MWVGEAENGGFSKLIVLHIQRAIKHVRRADKRAAGLSTRYVTMVLLHRNWRS